MAIVMAACRMSRFTIAVRSLARCKMHYSQAAGSLGIKVNLVETHVDWAGQAGLHPARIRGRKWLPGSDSPNYPEFLKPPRDRYPYVFVPKDEIDATPEECAVAVRDVIEKSNNGAVLFRGLPLQTAEDFSRVVNNMGLKLLGYEGESAVRNKFAKAVQTTSDDPPEFCIEPHNEMVYTSHFPDKVIFFCVEPPSPGAGGETVIADVRDILPRLDRDVVAKFERLGVMYWHHLSADVPGSYQYWQKVFQPEDRSYIKRHVSANNNWKYWKYEDDSLSRWLTLPPTHQYRGEKLWFCSIHLMNASHLKAHPLWFDKDLPDHLYPFNTYYGDGTEIEPEVIQHIRDVHWQASMGFQMQKGDLLVMNNMYCQQGRLGWTGGRKLAVAMARRPKRSFFI